MNHDDDEDCEDFRIDDDADDWQSYALVAVLVVIAMLVILAFRVVH